MGIMRKLQSLMGWSGKCYCDTKFKSKILLLADNCCYWIFLSPVGAIRSYGFLEIGFLYFLWCFNVYIVSICVFFLRAHLIWSLALLCVPHLRLSFLWPPHPTPPPPFPWWIINNDGSPTTRRWWGGSLVTTLQAWGNASLVLNKQVKRENIHQRLEIGSWSCLCTSDELWQPFQHNTRTAPTNNQRSQPRQRSETKRTATDSPRQRRPRRK